MHGMPKDSCLKSSVVPRQNKPKGSHRVKITVHRHTVGGLLPVPVSAATVRIQPCSPLLLFNPAA